jgi:hypothetical protein
VKISNSQLSLVVKSFQYDNIIFKILLKSCMEFAWIQTHYMYAFNSTQKFNCRVDDWEGVCHIIWTNKKDWPYILYQQSKNFCAIYIPFKPILRLFDCANSVLHTRDQLMILTNVQDPSNWKRQMAHKSRAKTTGRNVQLWKRSVTPTTNISPPRIEQLGTCTLRKYCRNILVFSQKIECQTSCIQRWKSQLYCPTIRYCPRMEDKSKRLLVRSVCCCELAGKVRECHIRD